IPMKILRFHEDVRPPYCGTVTSQPSERLKRAARKPHSRVLALNYDYDSEAEWVAEDGEDLDAPDDEEDDADGDDDMAEFLDDSEDAGPARAAFAQDMAPASTGLCFEDGNR